MHVIFEGILNRETCLLILAFINDKNYFTLSLELLSFHMGVQKSEIDHHAQLHLQI